jgi:uncharacterized protein (DUF1330 family)
MSAYVIVEVSIHDHEEYEQYKKLTPAAIAAFDGKFLVRGGESTALEGDWKPERIVVLEFPSVENANEWWNSKLYTEAKLIRQRSAKTKMIIIQGV